MHLKTILCALALSLPIAADVGAFPATAKDKATTSRPAMGWDDRPEAAIWTAKALMALSEHDAVLAGRVPADIAVWCPGYADATIEERRAFWSGLMSAVAYHESRWLPHVVGGGGRYIGLMQISPGTAKGVGCEVQNSSGLKDGGENLACAVEIMAWQVKRDGVVAGPKANGGVARHWGPMKSSKKRAQMAAFTKAQDYCR